MLGEPRYIPLPPRFQFLEEVTSLGGKALSFLPSPLRDALIFNRRRPRREGKPLAHTSQLSLLNIAGLIGQSTVFNFREHLHTLTEIMRKPQVEDNIIQRRWQAIQTQKTILLRVSTYITSFLGVVLDMAFFTHM